MFYGNSYLVLFLKGIFWAQLKNINRALVASHTFTFGSRAAFTEAGLTHVYYTKP